MLGRCTASPLLGECCISGCRPWWPWLWPWLTVRPRSGGWISREGPWPCAGWPCRMIGDGWPCGPLWPAELGGTSALEWLAWLLEPALLMASRLGGLTGEGTALFRDAASAAPMPAPLSDGGELAVLQGLDDTLVGEQVVFLR